MEPHMLALNSEWFFEVFWIGCSGTEDATLGTGGLLWELHD